MAERAKLRKLQIADIQDQINRSEAWEKFAVGACVKVKRTHWGKKYSDNLPDHITPFYSGCINYHTRLKSDKRVGWLATPIASQ